MGEDRGRRSDRNYPVKTSWRTLVVRGRKGPDLSGNERMVALMRWLRGDSSLDKQFVDPERERVITDPMEVNWARFPLQDAMAAVSLDEGRTSGIHVRPTRVTPTPRSITPSGGTPVPKSRSATTARSK
jgi:hypothetical protein